MKSHVIRTFEEQNHALRKKIEEMIDDPIQVVPLNLILKERSNTLAIAANRVETDIREMKYGNEEYSESAFDAKRIRLVQLRSHKNEVDRILQVVNDITSNGRELGIVPLWSSRFV